MKKMPLTVILILAGLLVCLMWLRYEVRRAPLIPNDPPPAARDDHRAADSFQGKIRLDRDSDYTSRTKAGAPLPEKLRREEERQKPWEGRN